MHLNITNAVVDVVETGNALQDRLVAHYIEPYSVTFVYWAFSFVFLYLGLQKVVPHRSTADVQLGTIAGLLGLPYIPVVTFVGIWQIVIGGLFLLRRLRSCAWFFFSYQIFTFATLVVLWKIVFQPPWIPLFGFEIPWALGAYAAFVLKNLIFAAIFFVLASYEFETASAQPEGETGGSRSLIPRVSAAYVHGPNFGQAVTAWSDPTEFLATRPFSRYVSRVIERTHAGQNYLVTNYFRPYGITILYWSYGFVWFYFGFQKPAPAISPVRNPLADFLPYFAIPLAAGMAFIGMYEMFLGILFIYREIRIAFWLFFAHQATTFFTLLVIPFVAFQPPWISLLGVRFPWALTGYGAFVVKNIVFVAGFSLLASIELGVISIGTTSEREAETNA